MSWWIKEHIAVNDDESKQLCSIEADNQTSLPAADQTATAGFIIVRGSNALVLDTGDSYIMNSSGTWIMQPSGVQLDLSGYATTQDLTDGLAEKVDTTTYTAGQAAQDTVINGKADKAEIYGFMPNIDSSTTITAYADNLVNGHYVTFYSNTNRPADAPVEANAVVEIYKYSASTIIIRVLPISTTYQDQFYQISKSGGTWRNWIRFTGSVI